MAPPGFAMNAEPTTPPPAGDVGADAQPPAGATGVKTPFCSGSDEVSV